MTRTEIELSFQNDEALSTLLENCQEVFDIIDGYTNMFLTNSFADRQTIEEARSKLTGCNMFLNPILSIAMTMKRNGEIKQKMVLKRAYEAQGKKYTESGVETEAGEYVVNYRRIRNIIQGYIWSAQGGIKDCESRLAGQNYEWKNNDK